MGDFQFSPGSLGDLYNKADFDNEEPAVQGFEMQVSSTCCAAVAYDVKSETLAIEFHERGSYVYKGFNLEDYQQFEQAESKGQYFNQYIRNNFEYDRIA